MKRFYNKWFKRWLSRRIPKSKVFVLNQRRIFIMPNKTGFGFSLLLLLLFITAINYQNSLMFFLVFFLASFSISAILHTYRNFSGLKVQAGSALPVYAGDVIQLPVIFGQKQGRDYFNLRAGWSKQITKAFDVAGLTEQTLGYQTLNRGRLVTDRLRIETSYPLGLLTAWTWLDLDFQAWIYPKPLFTDFVYADQGSEEEGDKTSNKLGQDDFLGIRAYQAGDALKHIAWKQVSKGQGLYTKVYSDQRQGKHWLSWYALSGMSQEERLSRLCGWILESEKINKAYGLILPQVKIEIGLGDKHKNDCLMLLARYGESYEEE